MRSPLACLLLPIVLIPGNRLLAADNTQLATLVGRGIAFLESAQAEDGSYSSHAGTGVTSLVTTALLRNGRTPQDPWVAKSLAFLEKRVRDDGGIYQQGSLHRNYETCLAIFCFSEADRDGRYDELLKNAEAFLKKLQWDDDEGLDRS